MSRIETWNKGNETLMMLRNENRKILSIEHIGGIAGVSIILGLSFAVAIQLVGISPDSYIEMDSPLYEYMMAIIWKTLYCSGGIFLLLMIVAIVKKIKFTLAVKKFEKNLKQFEPKRWVPGPDSEQNFECVSINKSQKIGHKCQKM